MNGGVVRIGTEAGLAFSTGARRLAPAQVTALARVLVGRDRITAWNDRGWNDRDWVSVATQSFEGRNDREVAVAGWRGRNVERIALRALNGDARCSRVTVRYNNGRSNDLNIDRGMRLEQGRGYSFDLPGRDRDVRDVMLHCSPVDGRSVRIEVLARK